MKYILSCDIGTTTLKTAIITSTGTVLALYHRILEDKGTRRALEWMPALSNNIKALKEKLKDDFPKIDAVCISGNGPTIVADDGTTLLWNEPYSFTHEESIFIPRIELFKSKYPETYQKTEKLFSGPEFLIYSLTGFCCTILPEERFIKYWWNSNYDNKLPEFKAPGTDAGYLTKEAAGQLNLPVDCKVYCGAPDFISAMVGTNTLSPGKICNRAGSSEGINLCVSKEIHAEGLRTMPSIIPGLWNMSYLIPESGSRFDSFINQLETSMGIEISKDAFFDVMMGTTDPSPLFEQGKYLIIQTALRVQDGLKVLYKAATENGESFPSFITMTGGQTSSDTWCHIKANITGINISVPHCADAELLGDAVFALVGMKEFNSISEAAEYLYKEEKVYSPENE